MLTHDALMKRRTVHQYKADAIPEEVITRALQAAMMAPNHKLTFPWRFYRPGPQTRQGLLEIGHRIIAQKQGLTPTPEQDAKLRAKLLGPPLLMVFCQRRCEDAFRAREDYATLACAIQNFSLSLTADGFGSKWSSGRITRHQDTYSLLGIDPNAEEIVGFVWAGKTACPDAKAPKRPPLANVLIELP